MENVAVLPVPDWALWNENVSPCRVKYDKYGSIRSRRAYCAITSRPFTICLIARCWMAEGFSKPKIKWEQFNGKRLQAWQRDDSSVGILNRMQMISSTRSIELHFIHSQVHDRKLPLLQELNVIIYVMYTAWDNTISVNSPQKIFLQIERIECWCNVHIFWGFKLYCLQELLGNHTAFRHLVWWRRTNVDGQILSTTYIILTSALKVFYINLIIF